VDVLSFRNSKQILAVLLIGIAISLVAQCQIHVTASSDVYVSSDGHHHTDSERAAPHAVCVVAVLSAGGMLVFLLITWLNPSLLALKYNCPPLPPFIPPQHLAY